MKFRVGIVDADLNESCASAGEFTGNPRLCDESEGFNLVLEGHKEDHRKTKRVHNHPNEGTEESLDLSEQTGMFNLLIHDNEELIDEKHAIVSSSIGPDYYMGIISFVDKDQVEPGCAILMHNKVLSVVGLLQDEVDPMVSVIKVEKATLESYADIGGLDAQIQEIKEAIEFLLTHPELYEANGIKPLYGVMLYGEPAYKIDVEMLSVGSWLEIVPTDMGGTTKMLNSRARGKLPLAEARQEEEVNKRTAMDAVPSACLKEATPNARSRKAVETTLIQLTMGDNLSQR
ncbi:26S proteasome regulatory subunit 4 homolog [Aristolochia californica]|uniref:26S proteasome regulatory subunit 4 homolog n=1 Tax=Aristolochia californica TaxID=171875 RepID=UPI0035E17A27